MARTSSPQAVMPEDYAREMVRTLKAKHGYTNEQLVDFLAEHGVPMKESSLSDRIRRTGPTPFKLGELVALADIFDVPVDVLLRPTEITVIRDTPRGTPKGRSTRTNSGKYGFPGVASTLPNDLAIPA